jgi:hypothetical protein
LVRGAVAEHARGKPLEIWWQDEARIGQQGTLTDVWADKGSRPRAPRDQRHRSAYLFGAGCPARRTGAALVLPCVSAEAINAHLAEISTQVTAGAHAVLILDSAGWHQSGGRLRLPENISLLNLPPYSPELNPVENVWEFLRGNQLSNRVYDTYDAILDACCHAWNAFLADPERIHSVTERQGHRSLSDAVGIIRPRLRLYLGQIRSPDLGGHSTC